MRADLAALQWKPARRVDDLESAYEQVVDGVGRGGCREPVAPMQLRIGRAVLGRTEVEVAAQDEALVLAPLGRVEQFTGG